MFGSLGSVHNGKLWPCLVLSRCCRSTFYWSWNMSAHHNLRKKLRRLWIIFIWPWMRSNVELHMEFSKNVMNSVSASKVDYRIQLQSLVWYHWELFMLWWHIARTLRQCKYHYVKSYGILVWWIFFKDTCTLVKMSKNQGKIIYQNRKGCNPSNSFNNFNFHAYTLERVDHNTLDNNGCSRKII